MNKIGIMDNVSKMIEYVQGYVTSSLIYRKFSKLS